MAFYAQRGPEAGEVGQAEMAEQRRIDELVKHIEAAQSGVMNSLRIWLRNHQWAKQNNKPVPASADDAMERLILARQEENKLWKILLGIENERQAIEKS